MPVVCRKPHRHLTDVGFADGSLDLHLVEGSANAKQASLRSDHHARVWWYFEDEPRFAADRLPFGEPVYGGRRTSGFGKRRDPKGRGYSLHAGLDIAGPRGTPIYTTADAFAEEMEDMDLDDLKLFVEDIQEDKVELEVWR